MSLSIIKPGLLDTIQDMGRFGFSHWGINPGGAMDRYAAQVANMLVCNDAHEAVIEMHFPGAQILFNQNALIAITGADFSPTINDEKVPLWQPVVVRKNTVLQFPKLISGSVCYLSIHGGICANEWLKSYATNLKVSAGGLSGRPFKKNDEIFFKENSIYYAGLLKEDNNLHVLPWRADVQKTYKFPHEISVIKGNEWDQMTGNSQFDFIENNYIIHPSSDRMGYQLRGSTLQLSSQLEMISSGVNFGTIQLLPDGQLVVLMADHQTTGGYPRVGHVISAHLPKLAQLRPSDCMKFRLADIGHAENLLMEQQRDLQVLARACYDRLKATVC
ncbi:MAG: biotin-dependent carboxyltransferase family protein [Bacteroidetes bacterium]|nr:biotin-dependent carboxyltransferase family protein [Bacteroidota bacterium]MBS1975003.1 biotin-dependent carboxyltransferase family protein [Bacteroidota bacterium]